MELLETCTRTALDSVANLEPTKHVDPAYSARRYDLLRWQSGAVSVADRAESGAGTSFRIFLSNRGASNDFTSRITRSPTVSALTTKCLCELELLLIRWRNQPLLASILRLHFRTVFTASDRLQCRDRFRTQSIH